MKSEFDQAAKSYDEKFTNSGIGRFQRNKVWKFLQEGLFLIRSSKILELNCGTGEDAIFFARSGHQVLATDISEEMLRIAKSKTDAESLQNAILFQKLDLSKPALEDKGKFDLIFSNFGGLNCIEYVLLRQLAEFCDLHLNPGGHCVFVIMPRDCQIDKVYRNTYGQADQAAGRKSDGLAEVNVEGRSVKTYYYNVDQVISAFSDFKFVTAQPVGFIPSYMNKSRILLLYKLYAWFLSIFSSSPDIADHYIIHLKKEKLL